MLAQYDGLVIGGSGEFYLDGGKAEDDEARMRAFEILERVRPLILYALENQVPLLGVCFGHQLVAEVRGGAVRRDNSQEKFGSHDVAKQAVAVDDPLFAELPESFSAQYWHKDSVTVLPEGAQPLACGERCSYAALRYGPTAYTVQFHPELSPQDAVDRLSRYPEYLPAGVDVDSVVKPSPEAAQLIPAFLDRIVGRKRA
jgi:GMP synthase (glutamine-hydrolysing)